MKNIQTKDWPPPRKVQGQKGNMFKNYAIENEGRISSDYSYLEMKDLK